MANPALALLVFTGLMASLVLLFWPRRGLLMRLAQLTRMTERVRIEDALKHLYKGEHAHSPGTVESLAGVLQISRGKAMQVLGRLEALGLARSEPEGMRLTHSGCDYALRIIRTHRLWERYLADETGIAPAEWHERAEQREHRMNRADADQLAAQIGNPLYDPHGDPIPTAEGELPQEAGVPLTALQVGDQGTIIHLEDEPPDVFGRIVATGLTLLASVRVLSNSPEGVCFEVDGRELVLEPVVAAQVTIRLLPGAAVRAEPTSTLADLRPGESTLVVRISPACQGRPRRRLLDLGLVPGTVVTAELDSATHDPIGYRIRGALIALRRRQAESVLVERVPAKVR